MSDGVAGTIAPQQRVFYLHPTKGWSLGIIESLFSDLAATAPLTAVTSSNARQLRLAVVMDEASGVSERIVINAPGGTIGKQATGIDNLLHPFVEGAYNPLDHDLFRVNDLHISTLLFCLKDRYERMGLQYSWLGETIISVNPFASMPYNGPAAQQQYLTALKKGTSGATSLPPPKAVNMHANAAADASPIQVDRGLPTSGPLPPHVWHIAEKAFAGSVIRGDGHQSVVVSGESGSGKTENTKAIIDFLGQLSALHSCNAVQKQLAETVSVLIKACNPILESFGNAKTVRNDNSSRFGKYTKLYFNRDSGVIVGGGLVTYLLEKSRIVIQGPKERNYHVFYELLGACNTTNSPLAPALVAQLGLRGKQVRDFAILVGGTATGKVNKDEPQTRKGSNGEVASDAEEFSQIHKAMQQLQVPVDVQESIWKCVAAILHLGEVNFLTSETSGKAILDEGTRPTLQAAGTLLGLGEAGNAALLQVFLEKSRTKILTTMATQSEAEGLRDAFSKALYVAIFDYLVSHINKALKAKDVSGNEADIANNKSISYIGVLDIFGFENFQTNSFEQLCINFANETLQGHYNRFTFINDEEECKREGVPSPKVAFPDNTPCLRLFDTPKTGIFAALDEESGFRGGTSDRFTQLLWDQWAPPQGPASDGADGSIQAARARFGRPKGTNPTSFSVEHFASSVEYKTQGWLEKNSDTLKEEASEALGQSKDPFIATLLPKVVSTDSTGGPPKKKPSVAKHFQKQLSELMAELTNTTTNFVRCIKPNMPATPKIIDNGHVGLQLESAGVVQTVALKRQGYPIRRTIPQFVQAFRCLCPNAIVGRGGIGVGKGRKGPLPQAKSLNPSEQATAILNYISKTYDWSEQGVEARKVKLTEFLRAKQQAIIANKGGKAAPIDNKAIHDEVNRAVPPFPYCVVGNTKVFLKPIAWAKLELLRRRYNMSRLKKCVPHLRRWVGRYRAKKAEQERRRLEELARLQAEAEARRQKTGGGAGHASGGGGRDAINSSLTATALQSGLPEEKAFWFEEVADKFIHFDIPILLDVVFNLQTKEQAVAALTEMQQQRLDMALPAPMRRMLQELGIREAVVSQLAASNVATMAQLAALPKDALRGLGMSEQEISAVAGRMLSQQSQLVVNQRLVNTFGGDDLGALANHRPASGAVSRVASTTPAANFTPVSQSAVTSQQRPDRATEAKVARMLELGIGDKATCEAALVACEGDTQRAVTYLLTGSVPSAPTTVVAHPPSRSPPARPAPLSPPQPGHMDPYDSAPPMPGREQGSPTGSAQVHGIPLGGYTGQPQVKRATPGLAQPASPHDHPSDDVSSLVDKASLETLVSMGFGKSHSAMALLQANNNLDKAMDLLMK